MGGGVAKAGLRCCCGGRRANRTAERLSIVISDGSMPGQRADRLRQPGGIDGGPIGPVNGNRGRWNVERAGPNGSMTKPATVQSGTVRVPSSEPNRAE